MQWKHPGSPAPRKFSHTTISWQIDYMPHKTTITGAYYAGLMGKLRQAIKQKRQGMLTAGVLLLHDNTPVHKLWVAQAAIWECGFEQLNHPPYSPDLVPSDYYLFCNLKAHLCGTRFTDDESLKESTEEWLKEQLEEFYFSGIGSLKDKWTKCIEVKGDYIEKWTINHIAELIVSTPFYELIDCPSYIEVTLFASFKEAWSTTMKTRTGTNGWNIMTSIISHMRSESFIGQYNTMKICRWKLHWKIWYTETHTEKWYKRRFHRKLHWNHTFVIQECKKN